MKKFVKFEFSIYAVYYNKLLVGLGPSSHSYY